MLHATWLAAATVACAFAAAASADVLTYTGSTTDWFTPANWDAGRVPGPGDDVVIGGSHLVRIDPALGSPTVTFRDLTLSGAAVLETLPGVVYTSRNETIDGGSLIHRSTRALDLAGDPGTLTVNSHATPGAKFNPTPKSKRDVILKTSVVFGLGGLTPASNDIAGAFGAGHYSTVSAENVSLDGSLALELFYGFSPSVGQSFQIMTIGSAGPGSGTLTGAFDGLPEGSFVQGFGAVGFFISYAGGDGNDVVLTTQTIPSPAGIAVPLAALACASRRPRRVQGAH